MHRNQLIVLLGSTFIGLCLLAIAHNLPLSTENKLLAATGRTLESYLLQPEDTIEQTYLAYKTKQSGVRIFTTTPALNNQRLSVTIADKNKTPIANGVLTQQTYLAADDTIVQDYTFPWLTTRIKEPLSVIIKLKAGDSLPLRLSITNTYSKGALFINGNKQDGDLALATLHPTKLDANGQLGAIAGVVFFIGTALITIVLTPKLRWWAAGALLVITTPLALLGFWFSDGILGIADWDLYFSYHEVIRRTILEYHVFPFWNPWICGGTAALADPEFSLFTPTFLLEFIFGIPVGFRLAIFLSIATTATGMLVLAKRLRFSLHAALLAALAGAFGSVSLLEIVEGHPNVFAAMWIPWIFWAWLAAYRHNQKTNKSKQTPSNLWTLLCGIFLALAFYAGGIYLLMYTCLAFIFISFLVKHPLTAIQTTIKAGIWALGLAALKLFPVLFWLRQFPDKSYASSASTLPYLDKILFGRYLHGSNVIFNQTSGWHEYGAYIGYIVFALALIGISLWKKNRIVKALTISTLAAILLSAAGPALKPYFDQFPFMPRSNISRFILFAIIPISLLAGYGLDRLSSLIANLNNKRRNNKKSYVAIFVSLIILAFVATDLMSLTYQLSKQAFVLPKVTRPPATAPYPIAYTPKRYDPNGAESRTTRSYAAIKKGYGTFTYCSVLGPDPMVRTIFDEEDNGIILSRPKPESLTLTNWNPNQATFHIINSKPTKLVLNANYAKGWFANNKTAFEDSGRVATKIPPGDQTVTFHFKTRGFQVGLILTLLTLSLATINVRSHIKEKRRSMNK